MANSTVNKMQRSEWIDMMRGFCMLMVILHHSGASLLYQQFLIPFFLSGFFFLSGYLFSNPNKPFNPVYKLIRIVETLIIPYFIYWALSYWAKAAIDGHLTIQALKDWGWALLRGEKLWFLSALVVCEIVTVGIMWITRRTMWALTAVIILAIIAEYTIPLFNLGYYLPWYVNNATTALIFLLLGYIYRCKENIIEKCSKLFKIFLPIAIYIAITISEMLYPRNFFSFASNYYSSFAAYLLYSICGIAAIVTIFRHIMPSISPLAYFGQNTLIAYFLCNQLVVFAVRYIDKLGLPLFVSSVLVMAIVSIVLFIPMYLANRFFPIISGKSNLLSSILKR